MLSLLQRKYDRIPMKELWIVCSIFVFMLYPSGTCLPQDPPPAYVSPPPGELYPRGPSETEPPLVLPPQIDARGETNAPASSVSQENLPLLLDLAQLKLKIISTQIVDQISSEQSLKLLPKEGYKLAIVELEGLLDSPAKIALDTQEFSILYEEKTKKNIYGTEVLDKRIQVIKCSALAMGSGWSIAVEGQQTTTVHDFTDAGPISIKIAVTLPQNVSAFVVRYPALAEGQASVLQKSNEPR